MRVWCNCLILFSLVAGSPVAEAQPELGKWWKNSEIARKLRLTEPQIGQIEQGYLNHQRRLADTNAQLKRSEEQLKALMQPDRPDEAKVQSQIKRVADARAALETVYASMMLSIRKALSREQWMKLEELKTVPMSAASARLFEDAGAQGTLPPEGVFVPGGQVKAPVIIYQRMPSYTQAARDARAEGIVLLEATVRKNGTVDSIKVLRGIGYGLDESAVHTIATEWKFRPGTRNGQPVDVRVVIETAFRLY
ncbi:MAG: TonB family protein [Acidobacteria bacterium]|nr:TonB family protein [Acidobacteriota bacterium]